jgi:hypothetical protein
MQESTAEDLPSNVIIFPKGKDNAPPMTVEELRENIISSKMEIASFLSEELTKEVYRIMSDNGYHVNYLQDLGFLLTTIKAIIFRIEKIYHPIQDVIDEKMTLEDDK